MHWGSLLAAAAAAATPQERQLAGVSTSATSGQRWKTERKRRFEGVVGLTNIDRPRWPRPRLKCVRAAVCTTINALTKPIEIVANASDWCLVVVGDAITPGDAYQRLARQKPDKVAYLSLEDQRRLPYETSAAMPERHFGRKNVGYVTRRTPVLLRFLTSTTTTPLPTALTGSPPRKFNWRRARAP